MRLSVTVHRMPKKGNTSAEYEDAFYPRREGELIGKKFRFAVADGASEGMLSGPWASILTRTYCQTDKSAKSMEDLLVRAHEEWLRWRAHYLQRREQLNRPIQWFEEPGLEKGAFSTLLGLSLVDEGWKAVALGDSCLFHVRGETLALSFPIQQAVDFGVRPFLIASDPPRNDGLFDHVHQAEGEWQIGDQFYLVTDALAHWLMEEVEAEQPPWNVLHQHVTSKPDDFAAWINDLRSAKQMRNDDVTLVCVEIV